MGLSKAATRILQEMCDNEKRRDFYRAEIVQEGLVAYCGYRRISVRSINELLRCTAISEETDGPRMRRYTINDAGRSILRRPQLADELRAAIFGGVGSFTIIRDKLRRLPDEP